jgi:uncharacterized protein YbjT (DUF2867 family)
VAERSIVAVAGATGFVGRAIVAEALSRGWTVRALIRDPEKAAEVLHAGDTPGTLRLIEGDATDSATLQRLLAPESDGTPVTAVVNAIGIRRERGDGMSYQRMHVRVTANLIKAAMAVGRPRFVQISALGTRPNAASAYHRTKYQAEVLLRESGLPWTILRPALIHGPDGEFMKMAKDWVLGRAQPFFFLPYFTRVQFNPDKPLAPPALVSTKIQPIAVQDVAFAAIESIVTPMAAGEVYELVGPVAYDWPTLLTMVRDALPMSDPGKKPRGIPAPLAVLAAVKARAFGLDELLPFGPSEPVMASEDQLASGVKAREQLRLVPRDFESVLPEYADQI